MKILVTAGQDVAPKDDPDIRIWKGEHIADFAHYRNGIEGIVCGDELYTDKIMGWFPKLKILYRCGNGWDNIDRDAARERGIEVKRVFGAYSGPVADSTVGLILVLIRRIISLDRSMHEGKWERERYPGLAMQDITIGIIGYGQIGREVFRRLQGFPCKVLVHRPKNNGPFSVPLDTLLAESDVVTLHLELNEDTHHFMDFFRFTKMKQGSYLVNTSRGGLINTDALIAALDRNRLAGAALDVFEEEPLPENHYLRTLGNVILSPHNTYWSPSERENAVMTAIIGVKEWLAELKSPEIA